MLRAPCLDRGISSPHAGALRAAAHLFAPVPRALVRATVRARPCARPCRATATEPLSQQGRGYEDNAVGRPIEAGEHPRPPRRRRTRQAVSRRDSWLNMLQRLDPTARLAAVEQLMRIDIDGAYIGLVGGSAELDAAVDEVAAAEQEVSDPSVVAGRLRERLTPQDKRLVTELVAGVTRLQRRLDYTLTQLIRMNMDRLDEPLKQILRIGLYELLHLELPPHAINEHVNLAKRIIRPEAARFANGVLRRVTRLQAAGELPLPPLPQRDSSHNEVVAALGVAFSHPDWMVDLWLRQYGIKATVHLMRWNNMRPQHGVRLCPSLGLSPAQLCSTLGSVDASGGGGGIFPSVYLPNEFVRVRNGMQVLLSSPYMAAGRLQVQDEAAGLVVALLDPQPGESVLDACAAPGGKTLFAAARMRGQGHIVAADISAARLEALRHMAERQEVSHMIELQAADMAQRPAGFAPCEEDGASAASSSGARTPFPPARAGDDAAAAIPAVWRRQYDRVLLDAPCSGLGVLAKRADLRWRRTKRQLKQLTQLQDRLLDAAALLVRPGGLLLYSTCSIDASENGDRVAAFLERTPGYELEHPPPGLLPHQLVTADGFMVCFPPEHGIDGAFAVRLRRRPDESGSGQQGAVLRGRQGGGAYARRGLRTRGQGS